MTTGFLASCQVCWSDLPVEVFRHLQQCGHCFCRPCLNQILSGPRAQRRCPSCRVPIRNEGDAQPIYIEIVSVKPLASVVAEGLGRMDDRAKVVSVQKAGKKLIQVVREAEAEAEAGDVERDVLEELLQAVKDFNVRVVPVFEKARQQEAEILELKKGVEEAKALQDQSDKVLRLQGEVTIIRGDNLQLRKDLKGARDQMDQANKLAAKETEEVKNARAERDQMDLKCQGEIRRLKGLLERNADDRNRERQKMDRVSQQRDELEQQVAALRQEIEKLQENNMHEDLQILETTPSLEFPLPLPTVHRPTTPRKVQFGTVAVRSKWAALRSYLHRTLSTPSPPNSFDELSIDAISLPAKDLPSLVSSDTDEIDEVVVDRSWAEEFEMDKSSVAETQASSRAHATRVWAILVRFYRPRFEDTAQESAYQKEVWSQAKRPSLWYVPASVFFLANCLVSALTIEEPIVLADKVFYYGISPLLSVPMIFMCAYNFPYDHPFVFQTFVLVSSWSWPFYEIFYAYSCGFYRRKHDLFTCGSKDFLSTFYYTSALQVVALFGVSLKRLPATIGAIAFLVLICVTIVTQQHTYVRNVINFIIFESVLLYMHNEKEQSARKLFMLRTQLKQQFEHTFKAQVNERQAADSKRRLTS
ncbi:hypothetical protein HMN09_00686200 [Mycena chlorophos]|uniref:RING-type domain-containing protein n=1 Tax=Mycena chlorophos TaxID=658473 RepID=A0A8H6SZQ6_MYCCL|nr:hypothetical protein HMN09_00686200 [Mycena chlorophos]